MSLLAAQNLNFSRGPNEILKNVSFEIMEGESIVLIGPSGAGKTSLLKLLCGLIKPSNGSVLFKQKDINKMTTAEHQKLISKSGVLFQKNALFDSMTCLENVSFPLHEAGILSPSEIDNVALEILEAVGLRESAGRLPDEISGGMQKRLGIARALVLNPEVVFYDDPTAGLDPITSKKIIELVIAFQKKTKATLITITNDMNRAYQLADRIFMVVDKTVIDTGSVDETQRHSDPRVQQFIHGKNQGPLNQLS